MNKKILTTLAVLLTGSSMALAGCSNQASKNTSSQKPTVTKVSSKKSTKTSTKKSTVLWDSTKDSQLKNFIDQWAPTMKQTYVKYDGRKSLKTSVGTVYPDDLSKVNVEGSKTSIGWSKNGAGQYTYNVVAIYNYDGTKPPLPNHITYFFAFYKGQTIVLVDQSRDGTPNLKETENTKLKSGFADIVAGKKATVDSDTANDQTNSNKSNDKQELTSDPKYIGIMVHQLAMPGDDVTQEAMLGVYTANGKYWIGTGTSVSNVGYTINGDTVSYYTRDASSGESTAEQSFIKHDISLSDLEMQYYSTDSQKQTVQSVADKMPAIENQ